MSNRALLYVVVVLISALLFWRLKSSGARQALLLVTSYLLYASWGLGFLGLLVFSSVLNYALGLRLRRRPSVTSLGAGILLNIALLSTFKYVPSMLPLVPSTSLRMLLAGIVLPVGISFWTFQAISYLLDLYQGKDLQPSLLEFLLYMAFWPTVLSGPICRLPTLLSQLRQFAKPSGEDVRYGLDRICIGLVMTALAHALARGLQLGQGLDDAFDGLPREWTALDVWCLAIGYGFELFFDFAGYSHIVIGAARLYGIHLDENFARPYLSTTPAEFWTRWHMSLSFWIRDYFFLPLAVVRREVWWRSVALVLSMIAFGLWHQGTVLFAIWGLYHGLLLVVHRQGQRLQRRPGWRLPDSVVAPLSWLLTFGAISLGWILFRANDASQALTMLRAVVTPSRYYDRTSLPSLYLVVFVCALGYFGTIAAISWCRRYRRLFSVPMELRPALYAVAVYIGVLRAVPAQAFTYFRF